jgi:hypothetical protein
MEELMTMTTTITLPYVAKMFLDDTCFEWAFVPREEHENVYPNSLAYHQKSGTLALLVYRDQKMHLASFGFDISAPGLNLICAAQAKGEWSGKSVRSALVVLTDRLEVFRHYTTEEIRDRVSGMELYPAHFWVPEEKW